MQDPSFAQCIGLLHLLVHLVYNDMLAHLMVHEAQVCRIMYVAQQVK